MSDQVLESIRSAITSGQWAPGAVHSVAEVAALMGVSRTPVREAVLKLADTGLITLERNVGFRVLGSTPKALAEIFHMRLLLEGPAVRLTALRADAALIHRLEQTTQKMHNAAQRGDEAAFTRADRDFHELAISGSGNDRLVTAVRQLRDATLALGAPQEEHRRSLDDILGEYEPILDAIRRGDADAAERTLIGHLRTTAAALLAKMDGGAALQGLAFTAAWGADEEVLP